MSRFIDADELLEHVWRERLDSRERIANLVKSMPTIEPEQKKGKWINHRNDMGHNIADCSECGEAMQWYDPDTRPNYCPNCGSYNGGGEK